MNFLKMYLFLPLLVTFFISLFVYYFKNRELDNFIRDTFFKKPKKLLIIRRVFLWLGFALLFISLLDPRGPEEKIDSSIPDQKTIIVIDSSASMLAEDVRPSRYEKSLLIARHFIRSAYGHKIAVVLFSDNQKRLVPFTDDLDLLDARVAGLEDVALFNGGSNISQAIRESLSYFKQESGKVSDLTGNILVFTDSEEHDGAIDLKIPDGISLAVVGVGTAKGAKIPSRDNNGVFRGYKKYNGTDVVSRLNEDWLRKIGSNIKNYKYWVVSSYTIPTEAIQSFFNSKFQEVLNKGSTTIRPVKVDTFLLPGLLFIGLSYLLYFFKSYSIAVMLILCFLPGREVKAQEPGNIDPKVEEKLSLYLEKIKEGKVTKKGKLKIAEEFLVAKQAENAKQLYEENLSEMSVYDKNNYGVALLANKKPVEALQVFSELQNELRNSGVDNKELVDNLRQNVLLALQAKEKQDKQKQKEQKEKEKKEESDQKESNSGDSGDEKKDKESKKKNGKGKGKEKEEKDSEKKDSESQEDKDAEKKEEKNSAPKNFQEKRDDIERKKKMVKVPGIIKQLMNDDRSLQKKYLDTSTNTRDRSQNKDW